MNIKVTHHGDYSKVEVFLNRVLRKGYRNIISEYASKGVEALREYTPKDTGKTANSWGYTIEESGGKIKIIYTNSNVNNHVNIAMILQYGHGTRQGVWVEGVDYINPALEPVFRELADKCWREVTR